VVFRGGLKLPIRYLDEGGYIIDKPDDAVAYEFGNKRMGFATSPFDIMDCELLGEQEH
jgi:hypothetical protein